MVPTSPDFELSYQTQIWVVEGRVFPIGPCYVLDELKAFNP